MVRWLNKKTIKILAMILIIGLSVPVIVAGTSSQDHIMALFSQSMATSDVKKARNMLFAEDVAAELEEIKGVPEEDFTIQGKWGIYDNNMEGIFKGFEEENKIYGKTMYNNKKVYFYLQMNTYLRTFTGVVIYNDNFHSISGNYIMKNERFIALWTCESIDGWFTGESL